MLVTLVWFATGWKQLKMFSYGVQFNPHIRVDGNRVRCKEKKRLKKFSINRKTLRYTSIVALESKVRKSVVVHYSLCKAWGWAGEGLH